MNIKERNGVIRTCKIHGEQHHYVNKGKTRKDGVTPNTYTCYECQAGWLNDYYHGNKETFKKAMVKYRKNNKEKIAEISKRWREKNKERCAEVRKKYYAANKKKISDRSKARYWADPEESRRKSRESGRKYYQKNKEKIRQYYQDNKEKARQYYLDNKEYFKAYGKKWREENIEKIRAKARAKYHAKKLENANN